jgi:hypothetical protein
VVVARVAVRDVAAQRAAVAHLRVRDGPRASTSSGHLSCTSFDQMSSFSVVIAPMRSTPPSSRMPFSSPMRAEVDQVVRRGEAHLHHRQQAVPAGQHLASSP